jgi:hypothetical protein
MIEITNALSKKIKTDVAINLMVGDSEEEHLRLKA